MNGVYFSGGGGLLSTAIDYAQFALILVNGGELNGVRLLSPRLVELMGSVFTRHAARTAARRGLRPECSCRQRSGGSRLIRAGRAICEPCSVRATA